MHRTSRLFGTKYRSSMEDLDELMDEMTDEEWDEYEDRRGITKNPKASNRGSVASTGEHAEKTVTAASTSATQVSSSAASQSNYYSAKEDNIEDRKPSHSTSSIPHTNNRPEHTRPATAAIIFGDHSIPDKPRETIIHQPKESSLQTGPGNSKRRTSSTVDERDIEPSPAKRQKLDVANLAGSPLQYESLPLSQPSQPIARLAQAPVPAHTVQATKPSQLLELARQPQSSQSPESATRKHNAKRADIIDVDALPSESSLQPSATNSLDRKGEDSLPKAPNANTAINTSKANAPPPTITTALIREQMAVKVKAEEEIPKPVERNNKSKGRNLDPKPKKISKKEQQRLDKERFEREKKMTHKEYIATLPDKFPEETRSIDRKTNKPLCQCLTGMMIFFAEMMDWKNRWVKDKLDLLYQHGADVSVAFDSRVVTHVVSDGQDKDNPEYVNPRIGVPVQLIPSRIRIMKWKWIVLRMNHFRGFSHERGLQNAEKWEANLPEVLYVHPERWRKERGLPPLAPGERVRSGIGRDAAPPPPPNAAAKKRKWNQDDDDQDSDWELERDKQPAKKKADTSETKNFIKLRTPSPSRQIALSARPSSISPFASPSSNPPQERTSIVSRYNPGPSVDSKLSVDDKGISSARDGVASTVESGIDYVFKKKDSSKGKRKADKEDPLAEFYEQAAQIGSDEEEAEFQKYVGGRKFNQDSFQCMPRPGGPEACPNQDVIDKLSVLQSIHKSRPSTDEGWKGFAYQKAIGALKRYPQRIESFEEAKSIPGIGVKIAAKIMEIIETGDLQRIKYERDEATIVTEQFRGIHGVGPTVATQWYQMGLRTLRDLEERKFGLTLNPAQEIGLKYYDDLNTRMPREEAKGIYDIAHALALKVDSKLQLEIMGSYRRGRETCGDLDILLTRNPSDGIDHSGVLPKLIKLLHEKGILIADLGGELNGGLEAKYMGVCKLSPEGKARRIDILCIPFEQWGAALLYFTGDDIFNRSMRLLAHKKGMGLNQRGLFKDPVRDLKTRKTVCEGTLIASRTEKEIFSALGVPWQEPHERIRA